MSPDKPNEIIDLAGWWSRTSAPVETASYLRRAVVVKKLKRILPIGGGILLLIVLLWPVLKPELPLADWAKDVEKTGSELAMLDLTYKGANDKGEPFTVTADKAVRNVPLGVDTKKLNLAPIIGLSVPRANLQNSDGTTLNIAADKGQYDENAQGLDLNGQVKIRRSDGMTLDAPQLSVDFKGNRAWTDQPVTASGDAGTITGQGMRLEDGGKTIIFTGQSRATFNKSPTVTVPEADEQNASQPAANQP